MNNDESKKWAAEIWACFAASTWLTGPFYFSKGKITQMSIFGKGMLFYKISIFSNYFIKCQIVRIMRTQ